MQIDEVVWQVINRGHCSFKIKTISQTFCRNEYNVTGLCSRQSCPLANSQYATIKEEKGLCYLYVKTAERAQKPSQLWEKVLLSKNYEQALSQIDEQLKYWSNFMIHKNKQRLTKLRQMLIRIRKMRMKGLQQLSYFSKELIPIKKKAERRDKIREQKALVAANLESAIEQELIERLKNGVYNEIMNYNSKAFEKIVSQNQVEDEEERLQEEQEEEEEDYSDEELIFDPNDLDDEEDDEDDEEDDKRLFQKQTFNQLRRGGNVSAQIDDDVKDVKKKKPKIQLQYEEEEEMEDRKKQQIQF